MSVISSFHIPVIPRGPLLPPHPTSEPNHSYHCDVMNNLKNILTVEVTQNCEEYNILDQSDVPEWLIVAHVELGWLGICLLNPSQFPIKAHHLFTLSMLQISIGEWPCARGCHSKILLSQQRGRTNTTHTCTIFLSPLPYTQEDCLLHIKICSSLRKAVECALHSNVPPWWVGVCVVKPLTS